MEGSNASNECPTLTAFELEIFSEKNALKKSG
jgi:hypothetical protein